MASTLEIVKSEIGRLLGLDGAVSALGANEVYTPYLTGDGLRGLRLYPPGKFAVPGNDYKIAALYHLNDLYDDFSGVGVDTVKWNKNLGSDGTAAGAIVAANNGTLRLTSGAGSTHTVAVNGAQIVGSANLLVSDGGTRFEARVGKISALTGQNVNIGLTNASTLTAPFTIAAGAVTATPANGVAFVQDSLGTNTHLNACAVNASGAAQVVALTQDIDTAAFHTYRIDVDQNGNASFYIDGALVATIALAVATTALLAPTVEIFSNVTAGSQTLDIDYIQAQNVRV